MSLSHLVVRQVRCIAHADLDIARNLTLVWGDNGAGKTSILEAIFVLGRGRSFRTRNNERLITHGMDHLSITGEILTDTGSRTTVAVGVRAGVTSATIGARAVGSLPDLTLVFPVQVVEPGIHKLIEEGGYRRRRWMDWAAFHVEPRFGDVWARYRRALRQRNAALSAGGATASAGRCRSAAAWDAQIADLGESLGNVRREFLERLQPYWAQAVFGLSGLEVELHYLQGWNRDQTLLEALAASQSRDELRRQTHVGPHRADAAVRMYGRAAREVLSRGQQKLVAIAMVVAQLRLLRDLTGITPTLLLDDPAAELDGERLERFAEQVAMLRCQLVTTSLQDQSRLFGTPERVFRAGQGRVQPL